VRSATKMILQSFRGPAFGGGRWRRVPSCTADNRGDAWYSVRIENPSQLTEPKIAS